MELTTILQALLLGGGVGLLQTLVGLGGGVILVPMLPLIVGMSSRAAVATSLMAMGPIAFTNAVRLTRRGEIEWRRAVPLGLAAAASAWWAARATGLVDQKTLVLAFSAVVGAMAVQALGRPAHERYALPAWLDLPVGLFAGMVSGFTGVSGGVVNTPYLSRVSSIPAKRVIPTSLGAFTLISASGATSFLLEASGGVRELFAGKFSGQVELVRFELIIPIITGAFVSSTFGIRLQPRLSPRIRLAALGVLLLGLCAQSVYKALQM